MIFFIFFGGNSQQLPYQNTYSPLFSGSWSQSRPPGLTLQASKLPIFEGEGGGLTAKYVQTQLWTDHADEEKHTPLIANMRRLGTTIPSTPFEVCAKLPAILMK